MQPPQNPYGSNPPGSGGQPNPGGSFGQPGQVPPGGGPYGPPSGSSPYGPPPSNAPYGPPPGGSPYGPPPGYGSRYQGPPGYRPMAPQGGQPRGTVSLDVIGEAWRLLTSNIGVWVLATVIFFAASMALNFVGNLVTVPLAPRQGGSASPAYMMVVAISLIAQTLVTSFLTAGLARMAIHNIRTGTADVSQMFSVGDVFGGVVLAAILMNICIGLGFILLIIPGVIAALGLSLTQQVIVDRKLSATEAMGKSWEAVKPHLGMTFVLFFVLGLINMGGALACCVGLLLTLPLTQIATALVYRDLIGLDVPDYPGSGAMPPGAYPGGGGYPGSGYQPPIPRP